MMGKIKNLYYNIKPTVKLGIATAILISFLSRNFSDKSRIKLVIILFIPPFILFCYGITVNRIFPKIYKTKNKNDVQE